MSKVIQVKDLVKRYRGAKENAVDGVSFDVRDGEFFCFLGPNGAGKTTTISILTTTLARTSGGARIAGYDVDTQAAQVREKIGVIFQKPSLDENLTAEENVRFHAVLYGMYPFAPYRSMPKAYRKRVTELSKILGIERDIFNQIKGFSGGMKRKLEIVRSLMHSPKVLFLDEPTAGLDPDSRRNLWAYLQEVREREKTTIFLTTHYLEEAETADRVCVINHGKIVSLGTTAEIKKDLVQEVLIIDAKNQDKLETELKKMRLKYKKNGKFEIDLSGKNVQKIIKSFKTQLSYLDIQRPTLEDAYLEIIRDKNGNGGAHE